MDGNREWESEREKDGHGEGEGERERGELLEGQRKTERRLDRKERAR